MTALKDIPAIISEHLEVLEGQGVQDLRISTCYLEEDGNIWKINIRYVRPGGILLLPANAAVKIDNDTGEVTGFWTDRSW